MQRALKAAFRQIKPRFYAFHANFSQTAASMHAINGHTVKTANGMQDELCIKAKQNAVISTNGIAGRSLDEFFEDGRFLAITDVDYSAENRKHYGKLCKVTH